MASTRNKNTVGDYNLQQRNYKLSSQYTLNPNSQYGVACNTMMPGNGLMPGNISWTQLSNNSADTESFLFGIGSTNLTKSRPPPFVPEIKQFGCQAANIYQSPQVIIPVPLVVQKNQRPFPV
jgi:hypothetical protein